MLTLVEIKFNLRCANLQYSDAKLPFEINTIYNVCRDVGYLAINVFYY